MSYNRHENQELIQAFYKEPVPFQGADPSTARCIFIGLDANFDEHIENSEIFDDVKLYISVMAPNSGHKMRFIILFF